MSIARIYPMAKRKIHKLTEKVRGKIKSDHAKLKLSDYDGEALIYLKKVRGAAKGRKAQRDRKATFEDFVVPKDSELYRIIEAAAKLKKMSVNRFVKEYKKQLMALAEEGDFVQQRETEYLIEDIRRLKKGKKVFVNDGNGYTSVAKLKDILHLQNFMQHVFAFTDIFMVIFRVHYKLTGDLSHYLPDEKEYDPLTEEKDIEAMLDNYYPEITYLKSGKGKKHAPPKKDKIIEADSKERKKEEHKARTKHRPQRKSIPKTSKGK